MCLLLPIVYFTEFDRRKTDPVKGICSLPDAESSVSIAALQITNSESKAIAASVIREPYIRTQRVQNNSHMVDRKNLADHKNATPDTMLAARAVGDSVIGSRECDKVYSSCCSLSTCYDHCGFGIAAL